MWQVYSVTIIFTALICYFFDFSIMKNSSLTQEHYNWIGVWCEGLFQLSVVNQASLQIRKATIHRCKFFLLTFALICEKWCFLSKLFFSSFKQTTSQNPSKKYSDIYGAVHFLRLFGMIIQEPYLLWWKCWFYFFK